jgi:hypothetical protein
MSYTIVTASLLASVPSQRSRTWFVFQFSQVLLQTNCEKTEQLLDNTTPVGRRREAIEFIIHLIGDIHMPLHAEGVARGGNDIKVLFGGSSTNLHFIWDVSILQKLTASNETTERLTAALWASQLYERSQWPSEIGVIALEVPLTTPRSVNLTRPEDYALEWATEANRWNCDYVLKDHMSALVGKELSGEYFEGAVPIVEDLVAKAAGRLATWINALAEAFVP